MPNEITKLDAAVKFFLDQYQYGNDDYNNAKDIVYPKEKDIINRKDGIWNVFSIDVKPKLREIDISNSDIISVKIDNPKLSKNVNEDMSFNAQTYSYSINTLYKNALSAAIDEGQLILKTFNSSRTGSCSSCRHCIMELYHCIRFFYNQVI